MDENTNKSTSCPDISQLRLSSSDDLEDYEADAPSGATGSVKSRSTFGLKPQMGEDPEPPVTLSSDLYGTKLLDSQSQDHVTVVFNWNYGGKEVYLVDYNDENRKIKLVKSTNCFSTIQDLPRRMFKYRYLVDNELQYNPEDPCVKTEDGFVNYIDTSNFRSTEYSIPREQNQLNIGTFGNEMPGPNYSSMEPPSYPDILNYRSPDFDNPKRASNEIHVLSNHIYEDSTSKAFLGPKYRSYMCLYRLATELSNIQCPPRSVSFTYVTIDEYAENFEPEEKASILKCFKTS